MRFIILGGPGAGKGTNAEILASKYGIPHISTGDIFRLKIKNKTILGGKIQKYVRSGMLVPDDLTTEVVKARLLEDDCKNGFILDGFPRNIKQADYLERLLRNMGAKIDFVLNLHADDDIIIRRMEDRRVCAKCGSNFNLTSNPPKNGDICDKCGCELIQRQDDNKETIMERLRVYHSQSEPLIKYYSEKGNLITVDSSRTVEHTVEQLGKVLPETTSNLKDNLGV